MGWKDSPPYFCAFRLMVTDITNISPHYEASHPLLACFQAATADLQQHEAYHPTATVSTAYSYH
jgi:hypothetical protein